MNNKIEKIYGNKVRIRVCGICIENDSILLIKHIGIGKDNYLWSPPGGGVEYQEDVFETLIREFKEETHLDIKIEEFLFINEYIESPLHAIELFFHVRIIDGELKKGVDPEYKKEDQLIKEVRFVTFKELNIMNKRGLHNVFHTERSKESILNMRGYFKFCP